MESLFLPILGRAKTDDLRISVLQFTWATPQQRDSIAKAAARVGIEYASSGIWRKPAALTTPLMILYGALKIIGLAARHRIDVLMPRSTIPGGMVLLAGKFLRGVRMLYDADGLPVDERKEFGLLREGSPVCRFLQYLESAAVERAAAVITRTEKAKEILVRRAGGTVRPAKLHVIPNGKDASLFSPSDEATRERTRRANGIGRDTPLLLYAGSLGPQYHPREMLQLHRAVLARRPDAKMLILTGNREVLEPLIEQAGVPRSALIVKRVHPNEVPVEIAAADLGIAFRTPSISQQGVSPIKVAEYLLCGVPIVGTVGVGDLDSQLDGTVGMLLDQLHDSALDSVAEWLLTEVLPRREQYRIACRRRGVQFFDLEQCAARYRRAMLSCVRRPERSEALPSPARIP
jgi:glycosyltransferase involved in cell wall biosynthesis